MKRNKIELIERYKELKRTLLLDGAMGSFLQQQSFPVDKHLWLSYINISNPKAVLDLHKKYIVNGADIITTNTFRTNPIAFKKSKIDCSYDNFVRNSVQLAISAIEENEIIIAGSNAPAEDCYQKERTVSLFNLEYNHKKHIELLWESGADFVLNETQSHWDEIEIISKFCSKNKIPFVISIFVTDDLKLLSGEPISETIKFILGFSPQAIGFNCISSNKLKNLLDVVSLDSYWGYYLNCVKGNVTDKELNCAVSPAEYAAIVEENQKYKPIFVGSCCGSNPNHTMAIKELFNELY